MEMLLYLFLIYVVATIAMFSFSTFLGLILIYSINACLRFLSSKKDKVIPLKFSFLIGIIVTAIYLYRVFNEPLI
jgi:glycopeptide antibiotics resistance protein